MKFGADRLVVHIAMFLNLFSTFSTFSTFLSHRKQAESLLWKSSESRHLSSSRKCWKCWKCWKFSTELPNISGGHRKRWKSQRKRARGVQSLSERISPDSNTTPGWVHLLTHTFVECVIFSKKSKNTKIGRFHFSKKLNLTKSSKTWNRQRRLQSVS